MFTAPKFTPEDAWPAGGLVVAGLTVRTKKVIAFWLPLVPDRYTVDVPVVAELLAVNVSRLLPVVGFGLKEAATPGGVPMDRFTLPVKSPRSVTTIVFVPGEPGEITTAPDRGAMLNPGTLTVRDSVVVAVSVPEVPVMVSEYAPVAAELLKVSVSTLLPTVGFALHDAVTPLGRPETERLTLPVNPPRAFTMMVDVVEPPW